jgi:SAM-dependent methyltransferase
MQANSFSIENIIRELGEGISILDGGAGAGCFRYADFTGCSIVALDVKPIAGVKDPPNVERVVGDLENLPFGEKSFHLVILNYVLEHTFNPAKVIAEITRVLKPDGIFYLSVPDAGSLDDRMFRIAHKVTHPSSWFYPDPDYHNQTFTVESLRGLLGRHGFSIVRRLAYPGGFNWMPRVFRNVFLRCCRTLDINPTRKGNIIALAKRGNFEEEVHTVRYVCFGCGTPVGEITLDGVHWRCGRCGSMNLFFPLE